MGDWLLLKTQKPILILTIIAQHPVPSLKCLYRKVYILFLIRTFFALSGADTKLDDKHRRWMKLHAIRLAITNFLLSWHDARYHFLFGQRLKKKNRKRKEKDAGDKKTKEMNERRERQHVPRVENVKRRIKASSRHDLLFLPPSRIYIIEHTQVHTIFLLFPLLLLLILILLLL